MLIYDIGYHRGSFSNHMLSLYPDAKIIAIEANPHLANLPVSSSNIILLNRAIYKHSDMQIPFLICDSNIGISSLNAEWMSKIRHTHFYNLQTNTVKVQTITIDELIKLYGLPDVMKLDVEGAERYAFEGLTQKCGTITFEWCEECFEDTEYCVQLLKNLGYSKFAAEICVEGGWNKEYNQELTYMTWEDLDIKSKINPFRKLLWGMIYAI